MNLAEKKMASVRLQSQKVISRCHCKYEKTFSNNKSKEKGDLSQHYISQIWKLFWVYSNIT